MRCLPRWPERVEQVVQVLERVNGRLRGPCHHADARRSVRHPHWDHASSPRSHAREQLPSAAQLPTHIDRLAVQPMPRVVDDDALNLVGGM
jgi:hypothetical protein